MKNILSSLNESEKSRILEMHYKASGKQYLIESAGDDIAKEAMLKGIGINSKEDPNDWKVWIRFQNFPNTTNKTYDIDCGGNWISKDIPSEIDQNTLKMAQNYVIKYCNAAGKVKPMSGEKTTTAIKKITSSDNYASLPDTSYFSYSYDTENSVPGNIYVKVFRNTAYPDSLYNQVGSVKEAIYSCKTKKWNNGEQIKVGELLGGTNPFEMNIKLSPSASAARYPQVQKDSGKTPQQISQEIVNTMCSTGVFK